MPNYQLGKIYSIKSPNTNKVYIGSSTVSLEKRFAQHKLQNNSCTSKEIIDARDSYIELLENYPCQSREELNRREGEIIRGTVNCINRNISVTSPVIINPRGFIVYAEETFFLLVSEISKRTHKIKLDSGDRLPTYLAIDGQELQLSEVPITDSRLFSACREYVYDRQRRSLN